LIKEQKKLAWEDPKLGEIDTDSVKRHTHNQMILVESIVVNHICPCRLDNLCYSKGQSLKTCLYVSLHIKSLQGTLCNYERHCHKKCISLVFGLLLCMSCFRFKPVANILKIYWMKINRSAILFYSIQHRRWSTKSTLATNKLSSLKASSTRIRCESSSTDSPSLGSTNSKNHHTLAKLMSSTKIGYFTPHPLCSDWYPTWEHNNSSAQSTPFRVFSVSIFFSKLLHCP
jgi:hypothetical protein